MAYFDNVKHLTQVTKIDSTVNTDNEDEILQLVKEVMPSWTNEDIKLEKMEGGIINTMYLAKLDGSSDEKLIVRVYFSIKSDNEELVKVLDRTRELKNLEKIRQLNIGPELMAVFNNGLCYKYLEGETLNSDSVQSEEMIPYVIKLLVKLHSLPVPEWTTAMSLTDYSFLIDNFPPDLKNSERTKRFMEVVPDKEALLNELKFLTKLATSIQSTTVYCHSDAKGENFIWNKKAKTLHFIDFEHSGANLQVADVAAYFVSFTDVRNPKPNCYPSREFQLKWIRMYLREYYNAVGRNSENVSENDIEKFYIDVNKAALILKFNVGIACLGLVTHDLYDSFEFCMLHLKEYFESKSAVALLSYK